MNLASSMGQMDKVFLEYRVTELASVLNSTASAGLTGDSASNGC